MFENYLQKLQETVDSIGYSLSAHDYLQAVWLQLQICAMALVGIGAIVLIFGGAVYLSYKLWVKGMRLIFKDTYKYVLYGEYKEVCKRAQNIIRGSIYTDEEKKRAEEIKEACKHSWKLLDVVPMFSEKKERRMIRIRDCSYKWVFAIYITLVTCLFVILLTPIVLGVFEYYPNLIPADEVIMQSYGVSTMFVVISEAVFWTLLGIDPFTYSYEAKSSLFRLGCDAVERENNK